MTIKGIPDPNQIADPVIRAWARAITERVNTMLGHTGDFLDSVPTHRSLKAIGVIGIDADRATSPYRKPLTEQEPIASTATRTLFATATFDATAGKAIGVHNLSITLPTGAYVINGHLTVGTTFTSATDAATIAVGIAVDDTAGIVAPIAISDASNPWDAGDHNLIQTGAAANYSEHCTAARAVIVTVGAEALTAGVFTVYIYYSTGA